MKTAKEQTFQVKVANIITLARRYDIICNRVAELTVGDREVPGYLTDKRSIEYVINLLQLPIYIRMTTPKPRVLSNNDMQEVIDGCKFHSSPEAARIEGCETGRITYRPELSQQ